MKFLAISMSRTMVQAAYRTIDPKCQTRRIKGLEKVNEDPDKVQFVGFQRHPDGSIRAIFQHDDSDEPGSVRCPYGEAGDMLWVREEYYQIGHWESDLNPKTKRKSIRQPWKFIADSSEIRHNDNPPAEFRKGRHHKDPSTSIWHKRLGRFMPKSACRIFLKITDVRVERLQDIAEADCLAEGILNRGPFGYTAFGIDQSEKAVRAFQHLWEVINGPESWNANPWVWVVSFERIEKPENFI